MESGMSYVVCFLTFLLRLNQYYQGKSNQQNQVSKMLKDLLIRN